MSSPQDDLRNLICLTLSGALAVAAGSARAAEVVAAKATTLQEVVVTATKRAESVQDIPMAVTALPSDFRDKVKMEGIQDIANFTPGLMARDEPDERLNIRGVGRTTNSPGSDPGVGVYVDGVYTSSTGSLGDNPIMVDRIEVLRGPQGTLYGRNTVGGAVNVISPRPTRAWPRPSCSQPRLSACPGPSQGPPTRRDGSSNPRPPKPSARQK